MKTNRCLHINTLRLRASVLECGGWRGTGLTPLSIGPRHGKQSQDCSGFKREVLLGAENPTSRLEASAPRARRTDSLRSVSFPNCRQANERLA